MTTSFTNGLSYFSPLPFLILLLLILQPSTMRSSDIRSHALCLYELNGEQEKVLLEQATKLRNKLVFAPSDGTPDGETNTIMGASSATLDFGKLNRVDWEPKVPAFRRESDGADRHERLPAQSIDAGGGAGGATYFDYRIEYDELTNSEDPVWVNMGVDSPMKFLVKSSTVSPYLYLADYSGVRRRNVCGGSHMICFHDHGRSAHRTVLERISGRDGRTDLGAEEIAFIGSDGGNFINGNPPSSWRATGDRRYVGRAANTYARVFSYCKAYPAWVLIVDAGVLTMWHFMDAR
ncbi:glycoside hydrolase family 47 protein [Hydnum rufescens UP504]|uniref:Glycoside hydrolase family 47 protein n=1 Tax=Hydnum rufescens UP504 TaxID=1448309 RepID=A0A9P6DUC2_9AGAM|nr:glycoside hydrolase family 47 protein [Hydnum rufescens UP504]